ncbi:MAG: S8 family serine peptidase [Symploca sp. SIO2E6]|nr:S8 family serine peptidase [Symploca sp. SIO2E6]
MSMFNFFAKKRHKSAQPKSQSFILEPILTPSGLLDGGDDPLDPTSLDTDLPNFASLDIDQTDDANNGELEEPTAVDDISPEEIEPLDFIDNLVAATFESGYFTVGETGEVSIDFLFDGGSYEGELAIFSLEGMEEFEPGSEEFIQEAANRALSNSELGHIVISDQDEGARFSGDLGETDRNSGDYLGVKTFEMNSGDRFGFMLVPKGTAEDVSENPSLGGAKTPLFSMATANPNDAFHVGQLADVTGDGSTFVLEDLRVDGKSDGDYNDLIFQVRGAVGKAVDLDEVIAQGQDWRNTDLGQALLDYAQPYVTPELDDFSATKEIVDSSVEIVDEVPIPVETIEANTAVEVAEEVDTATEEVATEFSNAVNDVPYSVGRPEAQPLIGIIDTGFSDHNPDIDYSNISLGQDFVDGDDNPLLAAGEGNEHGTHVLGVIAAQQDNDIGIDGINDDAPIWLSRAIGSGKWAESLIEFVDAARYSGQPNAIVNLSFDLIQVDDQGTISTRYEFTPIEMAALEYARQNNILVAVGAGNDGEVMSALGQASQQFDNIITVGSAEQINGETSVWQGFDRSEYSNYGEGLDIVANGGSLENPVISTVGDGLGSMEGTSVATAQVTGATSQVWAANPELSYRQVIEILKSTATDLKTANPDVETGAGLLNIAAAIHLAKATQPEAYDPQLQVVPTTWSGEGQITPLERAIRRAYTMQPNETLWGIAQRELGDGNLWPEITKDEAGTTPFTEAEARNLPVGQVVYLPGDDSTPQPNPDPVKQTAFDNFLQAFGNLSSPSWLSFLKEMFENFYQNPNSTLDSQAPQQGTGLTDNNPVAPIQSSNTLAGKQILLDPGHGKTDTGFDPGASGNGTNEAVENLHQAQVVAQHLRQLGAEVTILDEALSLAQIGQQAAGYDLFVSLHLNAANQSAQGHEVFSHPNAPAQDAELAQAINSELDAIFPDSEIPNRGVKSFDFSVLRNAPLEVPAVLTESLFIDAPGMSRANVEKAGHAIARGIEKFFTGQATGALPTPSPQPPSQPFQSGVVNSKVEGLPLNFRADSYVGAQIIDQLAEGTELKVLQSVNGGTYDPGTGSRNDWYQVEVNGQQGYVAAYYVDITAANAPAGFHPENFSGWVGPSIGVALRNSPQHDDRSGLAEPHKKTLHFDGWTYGESVEDLWTGEPDALWYRYWRDGQAYWVPSAYIFGYPGSQPPIQPGGSSNPGNITKEGHVNSKVENFALNFRNKPSTSGSAVIGKLPQGTTVTILEQVSGGVYPPGNRTDWYKIEVNGQTGYVAAYYIDEGSGNSDNGSSAKFTQQEYYQRLYGHTEGHWTRGVGNGHNGIDTTDTIPPYHIRAVVGGEVIHVKNGLQLNGVANLYNQGIFNRGYHPTTGNLEIASNYNAEVIIWNPDLNRRFIYLHFSEVSVQKGDRINPGDVIGIEGSTGYSTGRHMHLEVKSGNSGGFVEDPLVTLGNARGQGILDKNYR